jgi:acyl carrier protein
MTTSVATEPQTPLQQLQRVFTDALELRGEIDHNSLTYRDSLGWDSLAHMQLVLAIESAFDVMLETDDVLALSSFPAACEILRRHGVAI